MQAQKMTLSKREIKLLFFAGCVGFLAIMVMLVILPLNDSLAEYRTQYGELSLQQMQIVTELAMESQIQDNHAEALSEIGQIRTEYSGESLTSEFGLMLTQKVMEHNLEPISQSISQPSDFVVPGDEESEAIFRSMSVTMVVSGSYNDVRRLLNTVEDIRYLRVGNINLRFTRQDDVPTAIGTTSLRFDILMLREDI